MSKHEVRKVRNAVYFKYLGQKGAYLLLKLTQIDDTQT